VQGSEKAAMLRHLTLGILPRFRAFSTLEQNPALEVLFTPAHPQVTRAVETVEKVTFQKIISEKWDRNAEKHLVFCVPSHILAIFEPVVGGFCENFSNKGFFDSLVSPQKLSNRNPFRKSVSFSQLLSFYL
jgi:hypothetical protein